MTGPVDELPGVSIRIIDPPKYILCPSCKAKITAFSLLKGIGGKKEKRCKECGQRFKINVVDGKKSIGKKKIKK